MKTFCPNCEKDTTTTIICEILSCNECGEDYEDYEKPVSEYWKKQACALLKHTLELTAFLQRIMLLGLLRGSPRLRDEALAILDSFEASDSDVSTTQDVLVGKETSSDNNKEGSKE